MFSLRFYRKKIFDKIYGGNFVYVKMFCVRKIFRTQIFAEFEVILCLKLLFRKCVTYVAGCSFAKTCSLTGC